MYQKDIYKPSLLSYKVRNVVAPSMLTSEVMIYLIYSPSFHIDIFLWTYIRRIKITEDSQGIHTD